jgi:hypothetical protein
VASTPSTERRTLDPLKNVYSFNVPVWARIRMLSSRYSSIYDDVPIRVTGVNVPSKARCGVTAPSPNVAIGPYPVAVAMAGDDPCTVSVESKYIVVEPDSGRSMTV